MRAREWWASQLASVAVWHERRAIGTVLLGSVIALDILLVIGLLITTHYIGADGGTSVLYAGIEPWCSPGQGRIGGHCFGDANLGAIVFRENPWDKYKWNYFAASMVPSYAFVGFGHLLGHPSVGIVLYTVVMSFGMTIPAIWAARGRPLWLRMLIWSAFGFLSIAALWATDRGNVVGFAVPFMFLAVLAIARDQMLLAAIGIALAAGAKPQFGLAILIFLLIRRYRWFFIGAGIAVITQVIPFLLWPRDFPRTMIQAVGGVLSFGGFDTINIPIPISVSFVKVAYLLEDWFVTPFIGGPNWVAHHQPLVAAISVAIMVAVVVIARKAIPPALTISLLFMISALAVPTSFPYYFIAMLPLAAIMLRDPAPGVPIPADRTVFRGLFDAATSGRRSEWIWGVLFAVTMAFTVSRLIIPKTIPKLPFYYFTTADVTTLGWVIVIVGYLVLRMIQRRRSAPGALAARGDVDLSRP